MLPITNRSWDHLVTKMIGTVTIRQALAVSISNVLFWIKIGYKFWQRCCGNNNNRKSNL